MRRCMKSMVVTRIGSGRNIIDDIQMSDVDGEVRIIDSYPF